MKNWLVAVVALGMGGAVSAALLVFANPTRGAVDVYAVARGVPAGAAITLDALRLESVASSASLPSLFTRGDVAMLSGARAMHELTAGQLLQRSDVAAATSTPDERLVLLPLKDAPPAEAGARVDLFVIGGAPDRPAVIPFALGIEVRAAVSGGLVVAVPSSKAAAFVYAAEEMHLVAVIAAPGAATGSEGPIDGPDQALAVAAQP